MKRTKFNASRQLTNGEKQEQLHRQLLFRALTSNILTSRMSYGNTTTFGGLRDVYTALGYPGLDGIKFQDYYFRYRRQDIAGKVIEKPVEGCWKRAPIVRAWDDEKEVFRFAWEDLEKKRKIYSMLKRADILARIGEYGVLLLGFKDDKDLDQPLETSTSSELLYLQPYTSENAPIAEYDVDQQSERFGLPHMYGLKVNNNPALPNSTGEIKVHHSRVIHIAEHLLESNVFGLPALERIYNRLLNLELLTGGSAEMFWQGAFPGLAFNADSDVNMDDIAANLTEEIKKYVHNLERYMKLQGIDVTQLTPAVSDPSSHVDIQIKMIAASTGIPKRILEGSERGELSSSQDSESWDEDCDLRRRTFVQPHLLCPVIDKCVEMGVLPEPKNGYEVEWPDLTTPSAKDKADTGKTRAEAIAEYTNSPSAQISLSFRAFLEEVLEMDADRVERIMTMTAEDLENMVRDDGEGDDGEGDDLLEEGGDE